MRLSRRLLIGLAIGVGIPLAILLYAWYGPGPASQTSELHRRRRLEHFGRRQ